MSIKFITFYNKNIDYYGFLDVVNKYKNSNLNTLQKLLNIVEFKQALTAEVWSKIVNMISDFKEDFVIVATNEADVNGENSGMCDTFVFAKNDIAVH